METTEQTELTRMRNLNSSRGLNRVRQLRDMQQLDNTVEKFEQEHNLKADAVTLEKNTRPITKVLWYVEHKPVLCLVVLGGILTGAGLLFNSTLLAGGVLMLGLAYFRHTGQI